MILKFGGSMKCYKEILHLLVSATVLLLPPPSHAESICDKYGIRVVAGGEYKLQNNIWGSSTSQCITPVGETGWRVDRSDHDLPTNGPPAAYPSIWKGCHWKDCTSGSGMPIQVSQIGSAAYSWSISTEATTGSWNAAPEAWFNRTSDPGAPDGTEIMWWFDSRSGVQPGGSHIDTVTLDGADWDVWFADVGWNFVTYRSAAPISSGTVNMVLFTEDAIKRGLLSPDWYLMDIEAGFEIWKGGVGLTTNSFTATIIRRSKNNNSGL
jgi:hypothetical protein